jgi:ectoine hydroxylase-related dioxygenase (phytanoyl-CoA dioxygenase family)
VPDVARRRTFLDPDRQRQFEDAGFVVVDLLDDDAVAALRAGYRAMEHEQREVYEWVEGFDTSIYDDRPEYRAAVLELIETNVAPAFASVLDRHRIMFANFVVKQPGSNAVPPHVDWTFVDEDRYSSVTIWCPLVDTTPTNGTLGLVTGSHRRIDFLRAANVPSFERCEAAVADIEDRPVVSLRAGQAIILDNRVVHFSPPNDTAEQRVAIGCVAAPVEAPLRHYWVDDADQLLRFELDRSFYLTYIIGRPPSEADGVLDTVVAGA